MYEADEKPPTWIVLPVRRYEAEAVPWTSELTNNPRPTTSNFAKGEVVPMPTLPAFWTNKVFDIDAGPPETENVVKLELAMNSGSLNSNLLFVEFHFNVALGVVVPLSKER